MEAATAQSSEWLQIVQQIPAAKNETLFLLVDKTNPLNSDTNPLSNAPEHFADNYIFDSAIKVIYQNPSLHGRICHEYTFDVAELDCIFTSRGVSVKPPTVVWDPMYGREFFPYDQILVLQLNVDGSLILQRQLPLLLQVDKYASLYQPEVLIISDEPPRRANTLAPQPLFVTQE